MRVRRIAAVCLCWLAASSAVASGAPGPKLRISAAEARDALTCTSGVGSSSKRVVLLTPAFSTDEESYGWNYLNALPALGFPTCSISLPDRGFADLQNASEYVVRAIRRLERRSDRKIVVFGHQHGALDELWALRFWPDLRLKVSDLVSLATPYRGTTTAEGFCEGPNGCPPSVWQIRKGSRFTKALRTRRPPRGPAYTSIATDFDELITPQPEASRLRGAANVSLQSICPNRPVEHFTILGDAVAYALVIDAIENPGPADPARLPQDVCSGLFMPGVDPSAVLGAVGFLGGFLSESAAGSVPAEPTLRKYARRSKRAPD